MNRRQFIVTAASATIGMGIAACNRSHEGPQMQFGALATPSPTKSPLPSTAINSASRMLMIFMLAASQHVDNADGTTSNLVDLFFPQDGSEPNYNANHMVDLGLDPTEIKAFVQNLRAADPGADGVQKNKNIRDRFALVVPMYDAAFSYGRPDCPSPTALQNIIATAKQQMK